MIRYVQWGGWRLFLRVSGQLQAASSSAPTSIGLSPVPCAEKSSDLSPPARESPVRASKLETASPDISSQQDEVVSSHGKKNSIVASVFESLSLEKTQAKKRNKTQTATLDERIALSDSVDGLLQISESQGFTRRHALRVVSILADWAALKRTHLADFESDPRFIKLCRLLGKGLPARMGVTDTGFGDLATVLGVTGDDEAAKLVGSISLTQMIRVMSSLAHKRRRSAPLLRSLAYNMCHNQDEFDLKQAADVLYAMAMLSFPDEGLLDKACSNLTARLEENQRPAVVGSVLTSLGLMRYKDTEVLDSLSEWVLVNLELCRVQDLVSLLLTLARVNHVPSNADRLFDALVPTLGSADVPSHAAWLDVVWSLAVLGHASSTHIASVLAPEAVAKLGDANGDIPMASRLRLLNINATAQLTLPGYDGPLLSDDCKVPLVRSREKQQLVASVLDTLANLLSSDKFLRANVDTGMGFLMDGECLLDTKGNPLPIDQPSTPGSTAIKVAIMVWDYHDMCRGLQEPSGTAVLASRLLSARGYRILAVPHTEFNPREKLLSRVRYLERQLKETARSKP